VTGVPAARVVRVAGALVGGRLGVRAGVLVVDPVVAGEPVGRVDRLGALGEQVGSRGVLRGGRTGGPRRAPMIGVAGSKGPGTVRGVGGRGLVGIRGVLRTALVGGGLLGENASPMRGMRIGVGRTGDRRVTVAGGVTMSRVRLGRLVVAIEVGGLDGRVMVSVAVVSALRAARPAVTVAGHGVATTVLRVLVGVLPVARAPGGRATGRSTPSGLRRASDPPVVLTPAGTVTVAA
jgi:hypothetical protein